MSSVLVETETNPLDQLELSCEVQFEDFQCPNKAEWVGYCACCRSNPTLACSTHKNMEEQHRLSHPRSDLARCCNCGRVVVFRDSVLWEKL